MTSTAWLLRTLTLTLLTVALAFAVLLACRASLAACFRSDVRALCCPSACAVSRSPRWYDADHTLTACARATGCYDGQGTLDTRMICNCNR